jgi:flavocytochrome c
MNIKNSLQWDESVDVAVIGSGFAGLSAAIEARNAGASAVVIEKMHTPGGNSAISDGGIAGAETEWQKKFGIKDSSELMYRDMLKAGLSINHPELLKQVTRKSNEVFKWTIDYLGVEYLDRVDIFGGHSVPRCYTPKGVTGRAIIKQQIQKLKQLDLIVRTHCLFRSFILDSSGTIQGISVLDNYSHKDRGRGIIKQIRIKRAVVLASGGFGSDVEFRSAQDPRLTDDIDTTNTPFATAEALKEAFRINTRPVHLSHIQLGPWGTPDEKGYGAGARFSDYIVFPYGILVDNSTGKRFINELADRKTISDAILNIGHPCIGIADSQAVKITAWDIEDCLKKNVVKAFDKLKELADHYSIPWDNLKTSVERYNGYFDTNLDNEYGKNLMSDALPISTPPYYGIRAWPKVHHTMGGAQINTRAQVLDLEGKPIDSLYAAGEVTGGVHGACRLGSCAITDCLVFGRIAGKNAASERRI